jgi:diguanylate cyclase (GGDEF)-like protein
VDQEPDGPDLRQRLIAWLEEERAQGGEPLPAGPLRKLGSEMYSPLIRMLAHLDYEEGEAEKHWEAIREHQRELAMALGRDPGLPVAVLDYFTNIHPMLRVPKVIELDTFEATERSAVTDGLTGLFNRRQLLAGLKREVKRSERHQLSFALIVMDLDDFKRINDRYGHLAGDEALLRFAQILRRSVREIDLASRHGGEEFALMLPATDRLGALMAAERIRRDVEAAFAAPQLWAEGLTVSAGIALYPEDAGNELELLERADQALYQSKQQGKNRTTVHARAGRRAPRFALQRPSTLLARGRRRPLRGCTRNLSRSGALVESDGPVKIGSQLGLEIRLRLRRCRLSGRVVRLEQVPHGRDARYQIGIAFDPGQEQSARLLDEIVRDLVGLLS